MSAARLPTFGLCPDCGRVRYQTRKEAKAAARAKAIHGVNAYSCGDWWHFGALPGKVRAGKMSRDRIR